MFSEIDKDNSGHIDFSELNEFMEMISEPLGMKKHTPKDVQDLLDQMDSNKD